MKIIKWRDDEIKRVLEGIDSMRRTMDNMPLNAEAVEKAIGMYRLGHRDMVDNLLYSVAVSEGIKFLTIDKELIEFIEENSLPRENIILPRDIE